LLDRAPESGIFILLDLLMSRQHGFETLSVTGPLQHGVDHILNFGSDAPKSANFMLGLTPQASGIYL
jgi:hypothetical protein